MFRAVLIAGILFFAGAADAKPRVTSNTVYYNVSGTSAADIRQELREKGPNGYWAYTNWYVRWTGKCQVSVEIDITLPRLINRGQLPDSFLAEWDEMIVALTAHENRHAEHGLNAAEEIEAANCRRAHDIIDKWAEQDRVLDRETQNGYLEGVDLPR